MNFIDCIKLVCVFSLSLCLILACDGGKMTQETITLPSIKDVPDSAWKRLSEKKIFFGHQSIGFNIMAGIEDVLKENTKLGLSIVETNNPADFTRPLFAHSRVGKNYEPLSKIRSFATFMDNGLGDKVDMAFFKFCNVDINRKTDAKGLFDEYAKTMAALKGKYPKTIFVHVTSPVRIVQTGIKVPLKKLLGKPIDGYEDNAKRGDYSELIRRAYAGKEPLFDLAMIESTMPDGTRATFTKDGKVCAYLVPEYTKDGGHLNEKGRKIVAEQLLIFLANLAE